MLSYSSDSSPFSSPVKKRQRLSSPTYDEQLANFNQADFDALEQLDAHLSQSPRKNSSQTEGSQRHSFVTLDGDTSRERHTVELTNDPENPFTTALNTSSSFVPVSGQTFASASALMNSSTTPIVGFSKASALDVNEIDISDDFRRSSSPEEPPNQDYDAWFEPAGAIPPITFQSASSSLLTPAGFMKASNKGLIAPSSAALAKAQAKMRDIWQESDPLDTRPSTPSRRDNSENLFQPASSLSRKSPRRPALQSVVNSPGIDSPSTPSPASFPRPLAKPSSTMTPTELFISKNSKPFKSPLLANKAGTSTSVESPRSTLTTPNRLGGFATTKAQHPLAAAPINADFTTPARHPKAFSTGSSVKRRVPTGFITPFKPGMEPGQPGRLKLEASFRTSQPKPVQSSIKRKTDWLTKDGPSHAGAAWTGVFNLDPPPNRQTLRISGLVPQQYTRSDLEAIGINAAELSQITPSMAMYYSFHTPSFNPVLPLSSTPPIKLGPVQAFNSLLESGCTLATQDWVNNHWGLILWKLAGMVGLDPERERLSAQKRWCWNEVMRQLFYRYERELNRGKRPPLRLVTTRDAPAAYPMILCVSDIIWNNSSYSNDIMPSDAHPELEVTDGWYRLRARIDAPMARAVRRGHIRIGRKIAIASAYLSSERKEGSEVLDCYNSTKLVISGNSSHMAPWHAKLGFSPGPCISTLRSLTPDGGVVAAMDLVVVKAHPIAYIEFISSEGGIQTHHGPMNESEEAATQEKWKKRWEHEMSKLRAEYEKRWDRYEGYLDRLERRLGFQEFTSSQDDFPLDVVEHIYDELEDPEEAPKVIAGLGRNECGSLARLIRNRLQREKTHAIQDMELELQDICPPRVVKSFRIIVVQDACTRKYPGNRKALLNVWDVLNLSFCEGSSPGSFEIGQRFMITNLKPTHQKSWMGQELGAEVYLCTGQHSRWTPIRN